MSAKVVGSFKHRGKAYSFYQKTGNPNLYVRVQHQGKPRWKCLDTAEKKAASIRAMGWLDTLFAEKWEVLEGLKTRNEFATIGEILAIFEKQAPAMMIAHPTALGYVNALENLLIDALGIDHPRTLKCTVLNEETLDKFVAVARAKGRPDHSISGQIGQARSIFSRKRMKHYELLKLPNLTPFREAAWEFAPNPNRGFVPFTAQEVIDMEKGAEELLKAKNPVWIVYRLMSLYGLRNSMVKRLLWNDFKTIDGVTTFTVRGDYAEAKAVQHTIDPALWEQLQSFRTDSTQEHIIPGGKKARHDACYNEINDFMKRYINRPSEFKKAYLLRRQTATVTAATQGIYAAQQILGYAETKTTEKDYGPKVLKSNGISVADIRSFYRIPDQQTDEA